MGEGIARKVGMSRDYLLRVVKSQLRRLRWWRKPTGLREQLAARYLRGSGLEIGALHNPLWVPRQARVRYVDRMSVADLRRHYPELDGHPLVKVAVVDDGEKLVTVAPASQDFLIANHFLEHTQDPIGTIRRHLEVLAPGGVLYLSVPDKRWSFDVRRPVTPLEHLYRDFAEGPAWSSREHYREWVELVEGLSLPAAVETRIGELMARNYSIHFHVWTLPDLLEMLNDLRRRLCFPFTIETMELNRRRGFAETIAILRKS